MPQNTLELESFRQAFLPKKEGESPTSIQVVRLRFVGTNQFGRPEAEEDERRTFTSGTEALQYILGGQGYNHEISLGLTGRRIKVNLEGRRGRESLIVRVGSQEGVSPRSVNGHHGVSTDYRNFFHIILEIEDYYSDLFDRGLAWLDVTNPDNPRLSFTVLAGKHTLQELRDGFLRVAQRGEKIFVDLLRGMPEELPQSNPIKSLNS